jgi:hypothetical protein
MHEFGWLHSPRKQGRLETTRGLENTQQLTEKPRRRRSLSYESRSKANGGPSEGREVERRASKEGD